jgi:hypothetical protein
MAAYALLASASHEKPFGEQGKVFFMVLKNFWTGELMDIDGCCEARFSG